MDKELESEWNLLTKEEQQKLKDPNLTCRKFFKLRDKTNERLRLKKAKELNGEKLMRALLKNKLL